MFGYVLPLHSVVPVLSCVTVSSIDCTCSGFTASVTNKDYYILLLVNNADCSWPRTCVCAWSIKKCRCLYLTVTWLNVACSYGTVVHITSSACIDFLVKVEKYILAVVHNTCKIKITPTPHWHTRMHCVSKKCGVKLFAIISSTVNRFWKFFHC